VPVIKMTFDGIEVSCVLSVAAAAVCMCFYTAFSSVWQLIHCMADYQVSI